MKNILVICIYRDSVDRVLLKVHTRVRAHYFRSQEEMKTLFSMERFDVYDLILIAPFNWQLPYTAKTITRRCRDRFDGPIVAVSSEKEWSSHVTQGGGSHAITNLREGAELIEQLLFPTNVT